MSGTGIPAGCPWEPVAPNMPWVSEHLIAAPDEGLAVAGRVEIDL